MIEKVNPCHPDKVADRIAGAIVDLAYKKTKDPKIAVEALIGHDNCTIIIESSESFSESDILPIVERIGKTSNLNLIAVKQDSHLAENQNGKIRCGDNGIFKGSPLTLEEKSLSAIARFAYQTFPTDGKYILDGDKLIICQSNAKEKEIRLIYPNAIINPLGDWTGGIEVDSGATNRKLGSDMGHSVTGGGLHGKDLSKADVSVNIWCFLEAQRTGETIEASCAIGDESINGVPYSKIVNVARNYINKIGGFETFAEWGLF